MPAPRGHPRYGGRSKGTPNKHPITGRRTFASETRKKAAESGMMPVDYMLSVMRDPSASEDRRDRMAAMVAPYVHPRLAVVDAKVAVADMTAVVATEEERRGRARQAIREAFAERPLVIAADYHVTAGVVTGGETEPDVASNVIPLKSE